MVANKYAFLQITRRRFLRSEERFSRNAETDLVCRLLLEKKKNLSMCAVNAAAQYLRRNCKSAPTTRRSASTYRPERSPSSWGYAATPAPAQLVSPTPAS